MSPIEKWTPAHTRALREALRMTVREFAEHLGVATRTVSKWEAPYATGNYLPETQQILDTTLRTAPDEARERFDAMAANLRTPGQPLLLAVLVAQDERTHEEIIKGYNDCARAHGEDAALSPRTFRRWLRGDIETQPRPAQRRVARHYWGYPMSELLEPAPPTLSIMDKSTVDSDDHPQSTPVRQPVTPSVTTVQEIEPHQPSTLAAPPAPGLLDPFASSDHMRHYSGSPWEVLEVIGRLRSSDLGEGTIESLGKGVYELCRQYPYRPANELRADSIGLLGVLAHLRAGRLTYKEHRELLNTASWLALLVGCIEYDMGLATVSDISREAAASLGRETSNGEIQAWAHEMASWFALTKGRFQEAVAHARAGQRLAPNSGVAVQLAAQEAKALARMNDETGMRRALDAGRSILDGLPDPVHPDHHFVIDPSKWDFYAMDCYRVIGSDRSAVALATEVIRTSSLPGGGDRWPMRTAEAHIALAVAAARNGELERATVEASTALDGARHCVPSLLMSAAELERELINRYPAERLTLDWRDLLASKKSEMLSP